MTAHATLEERQRCLAAGMNDHISKPIDPRVLFETVGRFCKPQTLPTPSLSPADPPKPAAVSAGDGLPAIEGLDTKDGLARVAGNQKLYRKLLRQFAEQQGPAVGQISAALAQGDVALAERLAHTLKGVAGNIGAGAVQALAAAVEESVKERKQREVVDALLADLSLPLQKLVTEIAAALPPEEGKRTVTVDPEKLKQVCIQLATLLADDDSAASDLFADEGDLMNAAFPAHYRAIDDAIKAFDFEAALDKLKSAAGKAGIDLG
jgi:HPt (histidine-containing phosphotransfer) domain-containing protein